MNQFIIDISKVDPNDVSVLFQKMYPEAGMFGLTFVDKTENGNFIYMSNVEINAEELVKYIEENAAAEKAKREDKMLQVDCKVIKYKGNYYILDVQSSAPNGEAVQDGKEVKIPLFD